MTARRVTAADGTQLAVLDAGPRDAPPVVFVHGIAQRGRVFERVLTGPLSTRRRLVALDLRGHGDSETPAAPEALVRARLADDLAAVIEGLGLRAPAIAAWSFGGVVLGEYLRRFGDGRLGGMIYLAGAVRTGRASAALHGPTMMAHARDLLSEDAAVYAAAARAFIAGSTVAALPEAAQAELVEGMLRVSARVRRPLLAGGEDFTPELLRARTPIATIHGALDSVVLPAMSELVATVRRDTTAIWLSSAGHLPWIETPAAFDAALEAALAQVAPA